MNLKTKANQPSKTGQILTHHTAGRKIYVSALTPNESKVFGQYQNGSLGDKPRFTGGEPIEMDGRDIDWETLTYNPENGRTGIL